MASCLHKSSDSYVDKQTATLLMVLLLLPILECCRRLWLVNGSKGSLDLQLVTYLYY